MCITVDNKERLYKLPRCICVCAFICNMAAAETWPVSFQKEQFNKQNISDAISDGITSPGTITKTSVHCSDLHIQANKSFSAHLLSSTLSSNHVVLKRLWNNNFQEFNLSLSSKALVHFSLMCCFEEKDLWTFFLDLSHYFVSIFKSNSFKAKPTQNYLQ